MADVEYNGKISSATFLKAVGVAVACGGLVMTCHLQVAGPYIAAQAAGRLEPKITEAVEVERNTRQRAMDAHERDYTRHLERIYQSLERLEGRGK